MSVVIAHVIAPFFGLEVRSPYRKVHMLYIYAMEQVLTSQKKTDVLSDDVMTSGTLGED